MLFWRFIAPHAHLGPELVATYIPLLVALSFFVAALAGYAALGVVEHGEHDRPARPPPLARRRCFRRPAGPKDPEARAQSHLPGDREAAR